MLNFPGPNKISAKQIAAIIKVYSNPPLDKKKPLWRWTLTPAVRIKIKSRAAANLVCTPAITSKPPSNTVYEATYAQSIAGANPKPESICEKPLTPEPPNKPKAICKPCATNIMPKANRKTRIPRSSILALLD